jgi:hypothetical protein
MGDDGWWGDITNLKEMDFYIFFNGKRERMVSWGLTCPSNYRRTASISIRFIWEIFYINDCCVCKRAWRVCLNTPQQSSDRLLHTSDDLRDRTSVKSLLFLFTIIKRIMLVENGAESWANNWKLTGHGPAAALDIVSRATNIIMAWNKLPWRAPNERDLYAPNFRF